MPLRVPEGCLGGGEQLGGRKQVRRVADTRLASAAAVRGEKEPGARECLARDPVVAPGSREPLLPYSEGFVYSRASAERENEKVGGLW